MRRPLLALAALGLALTPACGNGAAAGSTPANPKADARPPLVRVAAVELRRVRNEVRDTTYLEAERRVMVSARVAGRVTGVFVDEGSVVEAGQLLARIDDREAKTTLAQVQVQHEAAKLQAELARLEADASAGRLEQAKIERQIAAAEWKRNSELDPAIVSPKILDDAKFALDKADETVRVAEFTRRKAELEVKSAENRIVELANKLEENKLRLAEHEIRAPFAGAIVERMVSVGQTLGQSANSALFDLADLGSLVAWVSRPQRELAMVRNSKAVVFTADSFPGREFTADIDLVGMVVDEATGSFRLRLRVGPDDTRSLVPGLFIRARILTEDLREALMVPKGAVLAEGDRSIVFVVRDDRAHKVTLEAGLEERDWIESRNRGDDGIRPEDRVVVSGHEDLRDQTTVEVSQD